MSTTTDILKRIDITDGVDVNYRQVTKFHDNTSMTDAKCDGFVYRKAGGKYYKRQFDSLLLVNLIKNSVAELRNMTVSEILMLKMGLYRGVELRGYYENGDIPRPVLYKLSTTSDTDNGGSVFAIGDIKIEHRFRGKIDARYFGASENQEDNSIFINKALQTGKDVIITGVFRTLGTIYVNSSQFLIGGGTANARSAFPKHYIEKRGSFTGVELNGRSNGCRDLHVYSHQNTNGGYGIHVRSARPRLENVSTANHGGDGIRIGDVKRADESIRPNCNLFEMRGIYSMDNVGWGVRISDGDDNPQQDCNTGLFLLGDIRNNGAGGVFLDKANDNSLIGIGVQKNIGKGFVIAGRGNMLLNCYSENNHTAETNITDKEDVHFLSTSVRNRFLFYYSGQVEDRVTDEGKDNFIIGTNSRTGQYFKSGVNTKTLKWSGDLSGVWNSFIEKATRDLVFAMTGTSANGKIIIRTQNAGGATLEVDGTASAQKLNIKGATGVDFLSGTEVNPNGIYSALPGSMYIVAGSGVNKNERIWVKNVGTDNTGWEKLSSFVTK